MTRSNGEVRVRRMVEDDLMKVKQIDRQLFGDKRVPTWPFSFETYWSIYGPGLIFVAEVGGKVVGFLAGNITEAEHSQSILDLMHTVGRSSRYPKVGWIDMIGVLPEYQGKRIGVALVDAFQAECKQLGAPMRAIIKDGDTRLRDFLVKSGFKKWETVTFEKE